MSALHRKLIRDLWNVCGQAAAICLVMACGVATFVMSTSVLESLYRTQTAYYETYRFADVFVHLKRAPNALAERMAAIPGVAQVETRIVQQVVLDVAGLPEPATGRLTSLPDRRLPGLNRLYLRRGRYPEYGHSGEVLVSEAFADAHHLRPGDSVRAVLNGKMRRLRIVGVALSPEFVYQIREGDLMPDDRRFGVFWMHYRELAAAFDLQGAFNDATLALTWGASERDVLHRLDRLTEPYGGMGAYGRSEQSSHRFIVNELNELRGMALIVPAIFLAVTAFLLQVVMSRLIGTQREQIATLKAFGYTRLEIAVHYLEMIAGLIAIGVALGVLSGAWLGREITEMYVRFFHFPVFYFYVSPKIVTTAFAVTGVASGAGTLHAVWRGMRLPPAEAMRPEPPARYRPLLVERLGLQRFFSPVVRMLLRQLERQPLRAALSAVGMALAVAVLILGTFSVDALNHVLDVEFNVAQRQDVTVSFVEPTTPRVVADVQHLPGVEWCEPFRAVPARLHAHYRQRRVGILGVQADSRLYHIVNVERATVPVPSAGLVLSEKLAEVLQVSTGSTVAVEVLEGKRKTTQLEVAAVVKDFQGTSAYVRLNTAQELVGEGPTISGAHLAVDATKIDELYQTLKTMPRVSSITLKGAALRTLQATIAENLLRMRAFIVGFAGIIAFGVAYNAARISLLERSRELATLRVIGFTRGEISAMLLGELAILTVVAIPLGLLLGRGLAALVIRMAYDTELFRIPLIIERSTYAFAASVTVLVTIASGLLVRRRLDRFDLVAVLKAKE